MLGFLRIEADLAAIQIRHEHSEAFLRIPIGDALDVIVDAPPFLDHDEAGRVLPAGGLDVITGALLCSVWTLECDLAHGPGFYLGIRDS